MTVIKSAVGTSGTFRGKLRDALLLSFPALFLCLIFDFVGGAVLGKNWDTIMSYFPILVFIMPGLMDLRGNIFSALASRFTTKLYLGLIDGIRDPEVTTQIVMAILSSKIPLVVLWVVGLFLVHNLVQDAIVLLMVVASAIFIGVILGYGTALITIIPFKKGYDPDLIAAPLISSVADLITMPTMVYFALLYLRHEGVFYALSFTMLALLLVLALKAKFKGEHRRAFGELAAIIGAMALIETLTGGLLVTYDRIINAVIIVSVMWPSVNDSMGNFGSIIAAKVSTKIHLEGVEAVKSRETLYDFLSLLILAPIIGYLTNLISMWVVVHYIHRPARILWQFVLGFPAIILVAMLIGLVVAVLADRYNWDPDNVAIPVVTTLSDVIGTMFLVWVALSAM
ncbi:magnesium transporter [Thermococcus sp. AM4]|uniref:magnesium transporter n=1 Tax=Thermococcus sp. (strain AM4) TaxID=246969 RepID=UPI00018708C3|nr:magnesium transporter [Thermococcus sp. AM4]EEB73180.1 mg2+ transport protein (mgte) [Thermococcus sp. AM4]